VGRAYDITRIYAMNATVTVTKLKPIYVVKLRADGNVEDMQRRFDYELSICNTLGYKEVERLEIDDYKSVKMQRGDALLQISLDI
jgi:hypothetical protein